MENRNDSSPQYFHLVFLTLTTKEFISQKRAVQNKEEEIARTCFFGNKRSAVLNSCKFAQFSALIFLKATKLVDNPYDSGMCFNVFRAQWPCQTRKVPPSTIPKTAEQGLALEAVSLELNSEDTFSLLARFFRDLSHSSMVSWHLIPYQRSQLFLLRVLFTNKIIKG